MQQVEIRIDGHLDMAWLDWLDGLTIVHTEDEQTLLAGLIQDQSAFYGLVAKLRDLGVTLVSLNFNRMGV